MAHGSTASEEAAVLNHLDRPVPDSKAPTTRAPLSLPDPGRVIADGSVTTPGDALRNVVAAGLGSLPLPGHGDTLTRWQWLAAVSARDLGAAKLIEGHADALAILAELGAPSPPAGSLWATWAAEPPAARVDARPAADGTARLNGTKAWCSGAAEVTHAVMSAWNAEGEPVLVALRLDQPGVTVSSRGWHAVGMEATQSVEIDLVEARADWVGRPHDYVNRPGFWQGGAGIAACWYGGACAIARAVHSACVKQSASAGSTTDPAPSPAAAFRLAHLGAIDVALSQTAALLREAAAWIDAAPRADALAVALRVRASAEAAAWQVLDHAGRALGATPYCRDPHYARMAADLPVFIRQSHAEQDLAALAAALVSRPPRSAPSPSPHAFPDPQELPWTL